LAMGVELGVRLKDADLGVRGEALELGGASVVVVGVEGVVGVVGFRTS
jgi:hypothetical protein